MQDDTALYGAKMMQPGMTAADSEENNLRPQHLEDYIGQDKVKQNLKIYLEAAKRRGEPVAELLADQETTGKKLTCQSKAGKAKLYACGRCEEDGSVYIETLRVNDHEYVIDDYFL